MPEGLNKEEQRAVRKVIRDAQRNDGIPKTAQQSIPFDRMFPDGICRVGLDYYTKTIQYEDINYQLAQQEDKTEIFEEWCSFLNFFDSSVRFQLSSRLEKLRWKTRMTMRQEHLLCGPEPFHTMI